MLKPVAIIATTVFVVLALALYREEPEPFPLLDQPLPKIASAGFEASEVAGEVFLINFFASWCVPCVAEHPHLTQLAKTIPIVGIAYRDKPEDVSNWLAKHGNPFSQVVLDAEGFDAIGFGISGVPETFVVANNRLRYRFKGPINSAEEVTQVLRELAQ